MLGIAESETLLNVQGFHPPSALQLYSCLKLGYELCLLHTAQLQSNKLCRPTSGQLLVHVSSVPLLLLSSAPQDQMGLCWWECRA